MKIFISHSLSEQKIALKLKELIENVSLGLIEVWLSSAMDGLKPGDVLWTKIHEHLASSNRIITILTPSSVNRPWLLYESGFVAGRTGAEVIPLVFRISKSDLPSPLSSYVMYSGENIEDLNKLLWQIIMEVFPQPKKDLLKNLPEKFITDITPILDTIVKGISTISEQDIESIIDLKFIDKIKASEVFQKKLADPKVENIVILTYTNEVEAGLINHYRVSGKKNIEIYKRSFVSDLREQQIINIKRILNRETYKPWNKKNISLSTTLLLEEEFKDNDQVNIMHYFYSTFPQIRAYIFDNNEAIFGYYETSSEPIECDGSIYKGMGETQRLWIKDTSEYGKYLLEYFKNYVNSLKQSCKSWKKEKEILYNPQKNLPITSPPCIKPKAVFWDLDGVIYDSLPQYLKAWKDGFNSINVDLPDKYVYEHEGRSGQETIKEIFKEILDRSPSDEEVEKILTRRNQVLFDLGEPPLMKNVKEILERIKNSGLSNWIVTGSSREGIKEQIQEDLKDLIDINNIITGNDVLYGKPHPEPYLMALSRAQISPCEAIVIENAPLGIQSAISSGAFCIALNTGILADDSLNEAGAQIIFPSLNELSKKWTSILQILES
jgi:HAD superfamily hydrolase (TIGR01509 family)